MEQKHEHEKEATVDEIVKNCEWKHCILEGGGRLVTLDKHFLFGSSSNNAKRFEVSLIFSSDKG